MSEVEEKQINEKTEKAKRAKNRTSLKNIIGGDILATNFFRRQTKLLVLIMVLILFYIHNRYACQQQMIEIDKLKKELIDIKYDALFLCQQLRQLENRHLITLLWHKVQVEQRQIHLDVLVYLLL